MACGSRCRPRKDALCCEGGPVLAHSLDVSSIQEHGANHCKLDSSARRSRRYLTGKEIERLMDCARKHGRYGHRDATMILVATGTDCGPRRCATCNGTRSSFPRGAYMSVASKTACRACIRSPAKSYGLYAACSASSGRYVFMSERGAQLASAGCWKGSARPPRWRLACIRTCCAMLAASSWQTRVSIRDRCSTTSATRTSSTPCATPRYRQIGSEIFGRTSGTAWCGACYRSVPRRAATSTAASAWAFSTDVGVPFWRPRVFRPQATIFLYPLV